MKKSLIALALVAPAFAGEPSAPVYVPPTTPEVASECPFSLEAGPVYTVATRHLDAGMGDLDMGGVDITGVYDINNDTGAQMLGDIVISIEKAIEQAELYGHSLDREIAFLTVHSMLHLLGYDHEPGGLELVRMREREEAVLTQLGLVRSGSYYTME